MNLKLLISNQMAVIVVVATAVITPPR